MKVICLLLISFNSYALTNSSVEENTFFNSVVFIKNEAPDKNNESIPSYCNATLIKPYMAITAAHCVQNIIVSKKNLITIEKGKYKYRTMPDGTSKRIAYVLDERFNVFANVEVINSLQRKFDKNNYNVKIGPDEDFAIIYWDQANFTEANFPKIVSKNELSLIIKSPLSYNPMIVSINPFAEMSVDTKRSSKLNNLKWTMTNYFQSRSTTRVEEGDSGAPLFVTINNENKVLAVVKGLATTVFDNWDALANVTKSACEINEKLPAKYSIEECRE